MDVPAPRSIGAVLDDSIKLWQAALARTWRLSLISTLLMTTPEIIIFVRWYLCSIPLPPNIYRTGSLTLSLGSALLQFVDAAVSTAKLVQTAATASNSAKGRAKPCNEE